MTPDLIRILLLISLPLFAGLGGAGLLLSNAQRQQEKFAARVTQIRSVSKLRVTPPSVRVVRTATRQEGNSLTRALRLFGCDYERRGIYPVAWWIVLLGTCAIGRAAVSLSSTIVGPLAYLDWPFIWIFASRSLFAYWDRNRRETLLKQFPDALAMIVRSVRIGIPVTEAIRIVAREAPHPTALEFTRLADAIAIGAALDVALQESATRTGLAEYRFFATALSLQAQAGGTLSESLDMLADIIRRRIALKARGYALTSEGRTSTIVLSALPFLIAGMLLVISPSYIMVMFTTSLGREMLVAGLFMLGTAIIIMRKMIRSTLA